MEMLTVGRLALARQGTSSRLTPADACAHPSPLVSTPADAHMPTLVAPSHPCSSFWTAVWPAGRRAEISSVVAAPRILGTYQTARREGWKDEARMDCEGERTSAARTGSEADESADASSASRTPHRCAAARAVSSSPPPGYAHPFSSAACSCGAAVCAVVDRGLQARRACNAKRQSP
ncbi:hypothetical protein BJ912DRAFT_992590 [Pholiota molesta]|nr:hypothetical protein BJ912DRAFT_992590 [Pholiota molesta]